MSTWVGRMIEQHALTDAEVIESLMKQVQEAEVRYQALSTQFVALDAENFMLKEDLRRAKRGPC